MRRALSILLCLLSLFSFNTKAKGESDLFTGGIGFNNQAVRDKLFLYSDRPIFSGWVSTRLGKGCVLDLWGVNAFQSFRSNEVDMGISCNTEFVRGAKFTVTTYRYLLPDNRDVSEYSSRLDISGFKVSLSKLHFNYKSKETKVDVGYSPYKSQTLTIDTNIHYRSDGLNYDDFIVLVKASKRLNNNVNVDVNVLYPLNDSRNISDQKGEITLALSYHF